MALHRKQRGIGDGPPPFVCIPTSRTNNRTLNYSLQETHVHAQRVYAKRYAVDDRSRKISCLQLRACFVLCVLLYSAAIYFADDIASIGRVVGSEQNSQSFFVHSLRPRSRGNVRVGRATDAKNVEEKEEAGRGNKGKNELQDQQELLKLDVPSQESPKLEKHFAEAAEIEKAQATEELQRLEPETKVLHQDGGPHAWEDASKAAAPTGIRAHIEDATISDLGEEKPVARTPTSKPTSPVEINGRHPDKVRDVDAGPAARPASIINQPIRGNVTDTTTHPPTEIQEFRPDHGQDHQERMSDETTQRR